MDNEHDWLLEDEYKSLNFAWYRCKKCKISKCVDIKQSLISYYNYVGSRVYSCPIYSCPKCIDKKKEVIII